MTASRKDPTYHVFLQDVAGDTIGYRLLTDSPITTTSRKAAAEIAAHRAEIDTAVNPPPVFLVIPGDELQHLSPRVKVERTTNWEQLPDAPAALTVPTDDATAGDADA